MTESQKKFADEIARYVKELGPKYNILVVSPIVAQAILESGWGTSTKAKKNNFFGLKCREGRVTCHNGTFVDGSSEQNPDGTYISITDQWYSFETVRDGIEGYLQFINISRYENLKGVTDWEKYIELIREDGYATSLSYVTNLKNVVKNNNLTIYDTETKQEDTNMSITVHLDPGHYGAKYNKGINKNYYESAMTWKLSGYLKTELENRGIKVTLSRNSIDQDPSLYDRGYGAKGKNLFLSLHSNACGTESVDYPLVIRSIKSDNNALALANKLGQVIKDTMGTSQNYKVITKQGSNGDYYGVIRGAAAAGVNYNYILEHGFHTNTKNCNWLLSDDNLKTLAKKEADTIASFFNVKNSNSTTETKTEEKKEENKTTTSTNTSTSSGATYTTGMYKVNVSELNIRKGPGTNYSIVGCIKDKGTYTIVEIKNGSWGRLKSGAGWINIHKNYCTKSSTATSNTTTTKKTITTKKSNETIAKEVLAGKWGNGSERKKKLEAAGYSYSAVQSIVNKLCK